MKLFPCVTLGFCEQIHDLEVDYWSIGFPELIKQFGFVVTNVYISSANNITIFYEKIGPFYQKRCPLLKPRLTPGREKLHYSEG